MQVSPKMNLRVSPRQKKRYSAIIAIITLGAFLFNTADINLARADTGGPALAGACARSIRGPAELRPLAAGEKKIDSLLKMLPRNDVEARRRRADRARELMKTLKPALEAFFAIPDFQEYLYFAGGRREVDSYSLMDASEDILGYHDGLVKKGVDKVIIYIDMDNNTLRTFRDKGKTREFRVAISALNDIPLQDVEVEVDGGIRPFSELLNDLLLGNGLIKAPVDWDNKADWSPEYSFRIYLPAGRAINIERYRSERRTFTLDSSGRVFEKSISEPPVRIVPGIRTVFSAHTHGVFSDEYIKGPSDSDLIHQMKQLIELAEENRQDFKGVRSADFIIAELPELGKFDLRVVVSEVKGKNLDEAMVEVYTMVHGESGWVREDEIEEKRMPEGLKVPLKDLPYATFKSRVESVDTESFHESVAISGDTDDTNPPLYNIDNLIIIKARPRRPQGLTGSVSEKGISEIESSI